tara:strand:+ start:634 stop:1227 length:594 start_codon:yes stop_codon:yes gene_type:complete
MLIETFSTKFYQFDNVFKQEDVLINILNTIKGVSEPAAELATEKEMGPTYKTNYHIKELLNHPITIFDPIVQGLNRELDQYGTYFEFVNPPWYAEYGPHDWHEPHNHDMKEINIMQVGNAFKYSCIINLSTIGETVFLNPNYSSSENQIIRIPSEFGRTIFFPSNLFHWSTPHRLEGRTRAIISFNCLMYGRQNANV